MIVKASVTGRCRQIKAYLLAFFVFDIHSRKKKQSCKVIKALIENTDHCKTLNYSTPFMITVGGSIIFCEIHARIFWILYT